MRKSYRMSYVQEIHDRMLAALLEAVPGWQIRVDVDDNDRMSVGYRRTDTEWWKTFMVPKTISNIDSSDPAIKMAAFMELIPKKIDYMTLTQRIEWASDALKACTHETR